MMTIWEILGHTMNSGQAGVRRTVWLKCFFFKLTDDNILLEIKLKKIENVPLAKVFCS